MTVLKRHFIFIAALLMVFTLNTCEMPMGLGDPIDWDPPILTLNAVSNPLYVGLGTRLSGTVTDNVAVDRVVLRDTANGEEIFRATVNGNEWEMLLNFGPERNGDKITGEIVAYDKRGNSGDTSIRAVTLIIDVREPIIDDIWIERTSVRQTRFEPYMDLKALEQSDPLGEKSDNANKYQNGRFWVKAFISEDETRIKENFIDGNGNTISSPVKLHIYDYNGQTPIWTIDRLNPSSSSPFSPVWVVDAAELLSRGDTVNPGRNYVSGYDSGERFYFRVVVEAYDLSENISSREEQGCFVLWKPADEPKSVLDPSIVDTSGDRVTLTRGSTLPITFFDDDAIESAYSALFTEEQWNGSQNIAPGATITGANDQAKLNFVRTRLLAGTTTYNWRYGKYGTTTQAASVTNLIANPSASVLDEKLYYEQTGNGDNDVGDFILVTVIRDRKLDPHLPGTPQSVTAKMFRVSVIDENAPLIVFDIQNGSPEENTFPTLTDGRYFTINGYTLRTINGSISTDIKRVTRFRMAWIPHYMTNDSTSYVEAVKAELEKATPNFSGALNGVRWWDFTTGHFAPGNNGEAYQPSGGSLYRIQRFSKTFDLLGGSAANTTTGIKLAGSGTPGIMLRNSPGTGIGEAHFVNGNGELENETKLFVFYAEDNMSHKVTRTMRLLGNKAPPAITVYDLSAKSGVNVNTPDINYYIDQYNPTGGTINQAVRDAYQAALRSAQQPAHTIISSAVPGMGLNDGDLTQALRAYPRGQTLKYWAQASMEGQLRISGIQMNDTTSASAPVLDIGYYDPVSTRYSYVETLPEVTQRTFQFLATDTLGNTARLQRTVTITNTAILSEITTARLSGTYGIGEEIILRAVFTNQVKWQSYNPSGNATTDPNSGPKLNVRYLENGVSLIKSLNTITAANTNVLALEFSFKVEEGFGGIIETMFNGNMGPGEAGNSTAGTDRPILLPGTNNNHAVGNHSNCCHILDVERESDAFTPINSEGIDWTTNAGSLQRNKNIALDGRYPLIVEPFTVTGKAPAQTNTLYFRTNETITFTLNADELIELRAVGSNSNPRIRFRTQNQSGVYSNYFYADYERSVTGGMGMVFSHEVSGIPDGEIKDVTLNYEQGEIHDLNGNRLAASNHPLTPRNAVNAAQTIRVDKTAPARLTVSVAGQTRNDNAANAPLTFNTNPTLSIGEPSAASEPWGYTAIQYSLDDGLNWFTYPDAAPGFTTKQGSTLYVSEGTWTLRTRAVDHAGNNGTESIIHMIVSPQFPRLISVSATSPNGTYRTGGSVSFSLVFNDRVWTQTAADVTITLVNRSNGNTHNTGAANGTIQGSPYSYTAVIPATAITQANASTTVNFTWSNINNKEMLSGLYVASVNFSGLRDMYGNSGLSGSTAPDFSQVEMSNSAGYPNYAVTNPNNSGIIIDCIAPRPESQTPVNAVGRSGNITSSVMDVGATSLTLTFNEKVRAGSGNITIKPRGQFLIPPVFENDSYYLNVSTGTRSSNYTAGYTKITGFYDLYNSGELNATDRNYLAAGTNMSNGLTLNARTGQSNGPYIIMTHGLKSGEGYTGDYNNYNGNGPNPASGFMVPDTSTKWVLDYRYSIDDSDTAKNTQYMSDANALTNASTTVVPNIRNTLVKAKFRWQELDVVSSTSVVYNPNGSSTVTITLNEALEKGLQWDICYPEGTFTDLAGNSAPGVNYNANGTIVGQQDGNSENWFWSGGVQTPVIRVNRKSFDARTSGWQTGLTYGNPANNNSNPAGWGINDFNRVHYRIETETRDARLFYGTINGRSLTNRIGSAYILDADSGAWPTAVPSTDKAVRSQFNWTEGTATNGTWAWSNLIRRASAATGTAGGYTVTENGVTINRIFENNNGQYRGFRSYNKDATQAELNALVGGGVVGQEIQTNASPGNSLYFDYWPTEARKDYVAAVARVNHDNSNYANIVSDRAYEGVFRSVVALSQTNGDNPTVVEGSNVKNGMPSIPGFPVRDAEETGDRRFVKVFHNAGAQHGGTGFYWVSTEIVSQWNFIMYGNGGSHQSAGEVNNYLTAGYGDLTFAYHLAHW